MRGLPSLYVLENSLVVFDSVFGLMIEPQTGRDRFHWYAPCFSFTFRRDPVSDREHRPSALKFGQGTFGRSPDASCPTPRCTLSLDGFLEPARRPSSP